MKKHAFRIGLVVTMLLGLMMISANAANCTGAADHTGTPWSGTMEAVELVNDGKYYLNGPVNISGNITVPANATATICLNGYNLNYTVNSGDTTGFLRLGNGATLNICDCNSSGNGNGSISNTEGQTAKKATKLCTLAAGKTVNMEAGTIKNFRVIDGLISMQGGTFNMINGKIEGCDVASTSSGNGYLIYWYGTKGGTFAMSGGEIGGNTLRRVMGAASGSNGTFSISGGTISETEEVVSSTMLERFATFSITGGTFANTTNLTANDGYYFYNNGSTYTVYPDGYAPEPPADQEGEEIHGTGNGFWLPYVPGETTLEAGKLYYLADDYEVPANIVLGQNITLCLHGHTLTSTITDGSFAFTVAAGATVNLEDCGANEGVGTLTANTTGQARGILVTGTMNMTGGTITGFTGKSGYDSGGVYVNKTTGVFNMSGGSITGNAAYSGEHGGGIWAGSGSVVSISGDADISNNTATNGGGIYATNATVNISDTASISDNTATNGGGIYAYSSAKVNVYDSAEISGNTAVGAAVYVGTSSKVTINGGYFYDNESNHAEYGYGSCLYGYSGTLTVNGGNFGLNTEGVGAPNLYVKDGATGYSYGANIYAYNTCQVEVTGGNFYCRTDDAQFYKSGSNASITTTGGSFSKTISASYLADGYHDYALAANAGTNFPFVVDEKFAPSSVSLLVQDKNGFGFKFMIEQADVPGVRSDYTYAFSNGATASTATTTENKVDYYTYTFRGIAAKDMGDEVTLTFTNNDKVVSSTTFSIKEYATKVLNDSNSSTELKQAMSDMLRYGAAAQAYFQPEETVVTDGMDAILVAGSNYTAENKADLAADANELYKGSSLSLKNNIVLNLYFHSSVTGVSVGGKDMSSALEEYNGYKVLQFNDIEVLKLSTVGTALEIVITAGDAEPITISDSVEAYAYRAAQLAEEAELTALCQAMMKFVDSVNACIPIEI